MLNWHDIFGTSDYDSSPESKQLVALSHGFIGVVYAVGLLLIGFAGLFWPVFIHSSTYIAKETLLDLSRILGRSRTKWGRADYLTILDSIHDWLFWSMGGLLALSLYGGALSFTFNLGLGTIVASFTYYLIRKGF